MRELASHLPIDPSPGSALPAAVVARIVAALLDETDVAIWLAAGCTVSHTSPLTLQPEPLNSSMVALNPSMSGVTTLAALNSES